MTLAATLTEAVRIRQVMRAEGRTPDECDRYIEGVLRQIWPSRGQPRVASCDACRDLGAIYRWCDGHGRAICGRAFAHDAHDYVEPCGCPKGARFREKPKSDEDFTAAGKAPRKMSRFGR